MLARVASTEFKIFITDINILLKNVKIMHERMRLVASK